MDTYSSRNRSVAKGPSQSEAHVKALIERCSRPRVRISVEGFDPYRFESEIKIGLADHFKSCGEVLGVIAPIDPLVDRRAFVFLRGHGAEEKALQLNGSCFGDWNVLVKSAPEEEEEEYKMASRYKQSLTKALLNDRKFRFGIEVMGYDTSLPADEVESCLRAHFDSCGEITHVYINTREECANIYFSEKEGEALALGLNGSEVRGFRITTGRIATAKSNPPLASGETRKGYTIPAHMIEFAPEINRKVMAFKSLKRTLKRIAGYKKASKENFSVFKYETLRLILSQKDQEALWCL
ncbi:hypothetical protein Bca4012_022900 [Brassica carinata]|uniref:RRM domain-containing protein n=1 Tax=Brassica carinata TaxID=52824 RepID=A0A8X7NV23_BRACI|nr:hypothetical protein Bca52824_091327 [Brassica carinata]